MVLAYVHSTETERGEAEKSMHHTGLMPSEDSGRKWTGAGRMSAGCGWDRSSGPDTGISNTTGKR